MKIGEVFELPRDSDDPYYQLAFAGAEKASISMKDMIKTMGEAKSSFLRFGQAARSIEDKIMVEYGTRVVDPKTRLGITNV